MRPANAMSHLLHLLQAASAELLGAIGSIEHVWLRDGRAFLCGSQPSLADVAAVADLETAELLRPGCSLGHTHLLTSY